MAHPDPAKIRNVAVLGHRGSGKTSLVEAMLHAAGETSRLGSVAEGTTVSDHDEDERRRSMSITASLCHLTWQDVKVNLIDTPGEPSFQGDALAALRAVDSALIAVNATAGVEVQTERLWSRAGEQGVARALAITMLDRERADFDATMEAVKALAPGAVAIQIPIGEEADHRGVINLVSMTATTYAPGSTAGETGPIPDDLAESAQRARERAHRRGGRERRLAHREVPRGTGDHHRGAHRRRSWPGWPRGGSSPSSAPAGRRAPAWTGRSTCSSRRCRRPRPSARGPRSTPSRASRSTVSLARTAPPRPTASRPWPTSSAAASTCCASSPECCPATATPPACAAARRSGWDSSSRSRARITSRCRRSARGTSARWPS